MDPSLDEEAPGGNRYWLNASMSGEVRWTHPPQGELVRNAELPLIVQADQRARNAAKAERTLAEAAATKSLSKAEWLELLQLYPNPSHQQWALNELHAWAVDGPASEHLGLMRKPSQFTTATIELATSGRHLARDGELHMRSCGPRCRRRVHLFCGACSSCDRLGCCPRARRRCSRTCSSWPQSRLPTSVERPAPS